MKRMTVLFITVFLISLSLTGLAQNAAFRVSGLVKDESQKPIEAATISLLNAKDSSLVKAVVTDKTGHFNLEYNTTGFLPGNGFFG